MRFPKSKLNIDDYLAKIDQLLIDDDCYIILDTNIFALIYKLYASARNEFYDWTNPLIKKERLKVPVWALTEYTNRFIRQRTSDYFSPIKQLTTTQKDFREIKKFLEMNIDSKTLSSSSYSDRNSYLKDLQLIEDKLNAIKNATGNKKQDYINNIHNELESTFSKTVLKSNIPEIFNQLDVIGKNRFNHKWPPGFEDNIKELNIFGDLIIWKEILEFVKKKEINKVIFLTNDNKKDWMYSPSKIIKKGIEKSNSDNFKIADERLVFEFELITNSEEFYIINFETLTKILVNKDSSKFLNLAKALQIANEKTDTTDFNNDKLERESENNTQIGTEDSKEQDQDEEPVQDVPEQQPIEGQEYSESAIKDEEFQLIGHDKVVVKAIQLLKSYDWYKQNEGFNYISSSALNSLPEIQVSKDLLFVLGRNIYQAACGGSFDAINFIQNISNNYEKYTNFTITHLLSGMLFEIYFNSKGEFRKNNLKTGFYLEILDLQENENFRSAFDFINSKLQDYDDNLIIIPSTTKETTTILITYTYGESALFGNANIINAITADGKNLVHQTDENLGFYDLNGSKEEIERKISLFFSAPPDQVTYNYVPEISNNETFELRNNLRLGTV